jgi:class 3 adenylate cyclase/tetratricopeptide (TPR) repeat protein
MTLHASNRFASYSPALIRDRAIDETHRHLAVDGTLVFVDVSGFTALSERLAAKGKVGAEEITDILNRTFTALLDVALDFGGDLLKFGGDALLLLFTESGHVERAAAAAFGMRRELYRVGRTGSIRLDMTVGVRTGAVDFFLAGELHRELVVTGPAATRTEAVEGSAAAGEIVVCPDCVAVLPPGLLGDPRDDGRLLVGEPDADRPPGADPTALPDLERFIPVALRPYLTGEAEDGEHRRVTIAFINYSGVDDLVRDLGPEAVQRRLHEWIASVQRHAAAHDVTFLATDISGDGGKIILIAGAPDAHEDDEERMLRTVRAIADEPQPFPFRIGINAGHVFAGDVGAPGRRSYTVMGDAVNTAARVMAHAGEGEVLATGGVLDAASAEFELEALPPFRVKGKDEPLTAFRVGRLLSAGARTGHKLPLIGRDAELACLRDAEAAATAGRGSVVEIRAEPGLGKSRLVEEITSSTDLPVFTTVSEQYGASTPYSSVHDLLRRVIGVEAATDPGRAGAQLRDRVALLAPSLEPWLPLIAIPCGAVVAATPETDALDPKFRRERLHWAVIEMLQAAHPDPAIFDFEDGHFMDESSGELLAYLVERSVAPWLVIVTRRPGDDGFTTPEQASPTVLELEPLSDDDAARLAAAAVADNPLLPRDLAELADRAAGHPLFLLELLAGFSADLDSDALPQSIEALLAARIDRLARHDRRLLRYASVLGDSFDLPTAGAALGGLIDDAGEAGAWRGLEDFLETTGPDAFHFRHDLYREAAYEGLAYKARREIHGRVGSVLERRRDGDELHSVLSLHFLRAQDFGKAWRYSVAGADDAAAQYANAEAARLYERALRAASRLSGLDPAEVGGVAERLGDVSELVGDYDAASSAYGRARRFTAGDSGRTIHLMTKQGLLNERTGQYSNALRWFSRALRQAPQDPSTEVQQAIVESQVAYAGVRFRQGRYRDAAKWCRAALGAPAILEMETEQAHALYLLDHSLSFLGEKTDNAYALRALELYERLGDPVRQANVLNNLGVEAYHAGRWDDALDYQQRNRGARERAGDVIGAAIAEYNRGLILLDQGRLEEAEFAFTEVLRVCRAANYAAGMAAASSNLGIVAARYGEFEKADELMHEALQRFTDLGAEYFELDTRLRIAERHLLAGDHDAALADVAATSERAEVTDGTGPIRIGLRRVRGCAHMNAGRPDMALEALESALDLAHVESAEYEAALVQASIERARALLGEPPDPVALDEIQRAEETLGIVAWPQSTPIVDKKASQ